MKVKASSIVFIHPITLSPLTRLSVYYGVSLVFCLHVQLDQLTLLGLDNATRLKLSGIHGGAWGSIVFIQIEVSYFHWQSTLVVSVCQIVCRFLMRRFFFLNFPLRHVCRGGLGTRYLQVKCKVFNEARIYIYTVELSGTESQVDGA